MTASIWWKATATAPGMEPLTVTFEHGGSDVAVFAEAERLFLARHASNALLGAGPRGTPALPIPHTLAGYGIRIIGIEQVEPGLK